MNNHIDKLKATADSLGVKYSPNIGASTLQTKIDAMEQLNAEKEALTSKPKETPKKRVAKERKISDREFAIMKAKDIQKVKIVNMDPQNRAASTVTSGVFNEVMEIQRVLPLGKVITLEECLCQEIENRGYLGSEPELDKNGDPTGNFLTISVPTYQVIRYPKNKK